MLHVSFNVYKFTTGIYYIAENMRKFNFLQTRYMYVRIDGSYKNVLKVYRYIVQLIYCTAVYSVYSFFFKICLTN